MSQKLVVQLTSTNELASFRLPDRVSQVSDCYNKTSIATVICSSPCFSNGAIHQADHTNGINTGCALLHSSVVDSSLFGYISNLSLQRKNKEFILQNFHIPRSKATKYWQLDDQSLYYAQGTTSTR